MSEDQEIDYSFSFLKSPSKIVLLVVAFVAIIVIQFPFQEKINNSLNSAIRNNPACPMNYEDYNFKFIGVTINNIQLSPSCTGGQPLGIKRLTLSLNGFSFSPFGPTFELDTELLGTPIIADLATGIGGFSLLIENSSNNGVFEYPDRKIALSRFANLIPVSLSGDIYISQLHLKSNYTLNQMEIFTLNLASKNFIFPKQIINMKRINPIVAQLLPEIDMNENMAINHLLVQSLLEPGSKSPKIKLQQITLGDDQSPLRAEFAGMLNLNLRNFKSSLLDLKGKLKIDFENLSEKNPLKFSEMFLGKFDQIDGFYQIQFIGPVGDQMTYMSAESPR